MRNRHPSEVVRVMIVMLAPVIALFGLYVIAHGHYGPGGGFAGGVILAVGAILPRVALDDRLAYTMVPPIAGVLAAVLGMLLLVVTAALPLLAGVPFLDYQGFVVGGADPAFVRYVAILVVEIAVGFAVFGSILLLYDLVAERVD